MKQIIALILFPLGIILLLFKAAWEVMEPLRNGINYFIEINYNFWAKIFKWKGR